MSAGKAKFITITLLANLVAAFISFDALHSMPKVPHKANQTLPDNSLPSASETQVSSETAEKRRGFLSLLRSKAFQAGAITGAFGAALVAVDLVLHYPTNPMRYWYPLAKLANPNLKLPDLPDDPIELYKRKGPITYIANQGEYHWTVGDATYRVENGEKIFYAGANGFEIVKSEELERLTQLQLIAEDKKFLYDPLRKRGHLGIDEVSILRAALGNLKGGKLQGASTITMQLALNTFEDEMTRNQSIPRKLAQIVYALQLEEEYTKREILDLYINNSPYTNKSLGIAFAAFENYGKNVDELTNFEMLQLIASLRGPSVNGPGSEGNYHDIKIYALLAKNEGVFTEAEYEEVLDQVELDSLTPFEPTYTKPQGTKTLPRVSLVNAANVELKAMANESPELQKLLEQTGFGKVYLSYDRKLQEKLQGTLKRYSQAMRASDSAFVAIDREGKIVAYLSYDKKGRFVDHARSPKGIASVSKVFTTLEGFDKEISFWSKKYGNLRGNFLRSNSKYFGMVGARVGYDKVFEKMIDLETPILGYDEEATVGYVVAGTIEIPPHYMAALMRLAWDGKFLPPHFIERIEKTNDPADEEEKWIALPNSFTQPRQIYSPEHAKQVHKLLCDNVYSGGGTASKAASSLIHMCAKTGTLSNDRRNANFRVTCGGVANQELFFYASIGHPNDRSGTVYGVHGGKAYGADACYVARQLLHEIVRHK